MTKKSSAWIDIPELLAPIPGKRICGESLRYTDVYDKIREARREEDEDLPQGIWKADLKKADWDQVNVLCQDALKDRTKDLQIAIWLTEARLHLNGVEGLAQGLDLILGLTQKYWDSFYPQMSKGSYELRLGLYDWLNIRLSEEIHFVPEAESLDKTAVSYQFLNMNKSCALVLKLLTKLKNELRLRLGGEAPSFYRLKEKIEDVQRIVSQLIETVNGQDY